MTKMQRDNLWRALKQGNIEPLYLLFGPEDYLRDLAANAIAEECLRDASLRDFNESRFSLASADIQHAIASAEQLPMMTKRRIVRITDFMKIQREEDEAVLVRYLARPSPTTVLILETNDLDKRRKLSKILLEKCVAVEFPELGADELAAWAKTRLKEMKIAVDERVIHYIISLTGRSARRVAIELEKLATAALAEGGSQITERLVEGLVGRSSELSNFELTDHLIARDRRRALVTLKRLLDDKTEPVMLLGLIASNYHRLALAKQLMAEGKSTEEVNRLVGLPFNKRQDFLAAARRRGSGELSRAIKMIAAADLAIKTSRATPRMQLEMLVCEITE